MKKAENKTRNHKGRRNSPLVLVEQLPREHSCAEARVFREANSQARNCCLTAASAKDNPSKLLILIAEVLHSHQLLAPHESFITCVLSRL